MRAHLARHLALKRRERSRCVKPPRLHEQERQGNVRRIIMRALMFLSSPSTCFSPSTHPPATGNNHRTSTHLATEAPSSFPLAGPALLPSRAGDHPLAGAERTLSSSGFVTQSQ